MALDKAYFDGISIELVKKKYYNANKVNAVFEDIAAQAQALMEENESLRAQQAALSGKTGEIGEALIAAQALSKQIVDRARDQADRLLRQARERAAEPDIQERSLLCVEAAIARLRRQQEDNIEVLNQCWQNFLCTLEPDGTFTPEDGEDVDAPAVTPGELERKVDAIARELREIIGE